MVDIKIKKGVFFLSLFIFYFLLSLGQYLYAIKFNIPWFGTNDFASYYKMTISPMNHSVENPWHANRILTPLIAWSFWKLNFYIKTTETPFVIGFNTLDYQTYDEDILSALITTNYFGLLFSALVLFYTLLNYFHKSPINILLLILFPLLIFLSPFNNFSVLAGMTEGVSILLISLILYTLSSNKFLLFIILIILSVFQRELIPLLIFFIIIFSQKSDYGLKWKLVPLLAFIFASLRILFNGVDPSFLGFNYSEKLPAISLDLTLHNIIFSLLYMNLFLIYFILLIINQKKGIYRYELLPIILYFASLVILYLIVPVGIQNLVRMLSLANPYILILIVGQVSTLLKKSDHKYLFTSKGNSFI